MERTPVSFGPGVFFILGGIFMDKVFKTYDEQIALLNSRGIEILRLKGVTQKRRFNIMGIIILLMDIKCLFW